MKNKDEKDRTPDHWTIEAFDIMLTSNTPKSLSFWMRLGNGFLYLLQLLTDYLGFCSFGNL